MKFDIWYMKAHFFRDGSMGMKWLRERGPMPVRGNLIGTHTFLKQVEADDLAQVFAMMQGENWSPNGEAKPLLVEKDLYHTSMSVGDIAMDVVTGQAFLVDRFGFVDISAPASEAEDD